METFSNLLYGITTITQIPQHIFMHGVILPQVQHFAFTLVELHEVPANPFLQPVKVTLDGSMTLWCINHSFQFSCSYTGVCNASQKARGQR